MSYAHPEYLVDTEWVAQHKDDPTVRILESDEDPLLYAIGHIPGAAQVDWFSTLQHPLRRDFLTKEQFEQVASKLGITNDTTVIFYADKSIRAFRDDVFKQVDSKKPLVDVRSPKEYTGELLHMPNYPQEGATRGGHIPGAVSIPWAQAVNEADSTFKTAEDLKALYEGKNIKSDGEIIAYCRIGERSSLTWFVLKYLLGYPTVKNYDGSWTEWGNLVDAPIEK